MSGGKGGSTTSSITIPEYIEAAAQRNLNKAERISQIGYTPYYGPDVAAFTPMQQAGFQNIADTAGAFGLAAPTTQQDIMGGMGPATTYAGGVQGYSSAPIYEQALQTLGEQRPGQKAYIDSFFIDPYSGGDAANNFVPIDYTQYNTAAQDARTREAADRDAMLAAEQMRMQGSALSAPQYNTYVTSIQEAINDTSYDPRIDVLTPEQQIMIQNNPQAQLAQEDLAMSITGDANSNIIDAGKGLLNIEPSFDSPSSAGSYGGSLVTGGLSGDLTGIPGITGNIADNIVAAVAPEYAIGLQGQNFAEAGGSTYDSDMVIANPITGETTTGGYDFDPTAFSSDYGVGEIPVGVSPATPIPDESVYSTPTDASSPTASESKTPTIDDLKVPGTSTLSVNESDTPAVGAVSDDGNWQEVVNPGTNAITREWVGTSASSSDDSGGGGSSSGGGGTVLCTAYASMGYLPADIWSLDTRYGIKRFRQNPVMVSGYRLWASPIANFIKTDTLAAKAARAVLWPMVRVWAEEMAHQMKPKKYSGNKFGKLVMAMGEPFSYAVGATLLKRNAQKEL